MLPSSSVVRVNVIIKSFCCSSGLFVYHKLFTHQELFGVFANLGQSAKRGSTSRLEMCMGMGFPAGMGIPLVFHGNGNENDFRGSGNVGKCFVKNLPLSQCNNAVSLL